MKARALLGIIAVIFNMAMFAMPAQAADWVSLDEQQTSSQPSAGNALKLNLDAAALSNDLGSSMLQSENRLAGRTVSIPVNDSINGVNFAAAEGHAFIYAKYDPENTTGTIFGLRIIRDIHGKLIQQMTQFTPADGAKFAKRYGTDPFMDFRGAPGDPLFRQISQSAFFTTAGIFLQHVGGTYGLIAAQSTRPVVSTKTGGNMLRKKTTTTLTSYTKPTWFWILPSLADVRNVTTIAGYKTTSGVDIKGGASFMMAGHGTDMPSSEYVSFQHAETQSSWTGLSMILVIIALSAITAGAAAYMSPGLFGAGAAGAGLGGAGGTSLGVSGAAGLGALGGALGGAAGNLIVNGGDWDLMTTQSNVVGGKTDITAGTSSGDFDYRPALHNGWGGNQGFSPSDALKTPGAAGEFFGQSLPSLKDQPRGATLARDALAGDVEKPQENSLGVDLGTTGLQGGLAVDNPFGNPLSNTGLQ